ncbi:hypothetical protein [Chromobacterium violaceum]
MKSPGQPGLFSFSLTKAHLRTAFSIDRIKLKINQLNLYNERATHYRESTHTPCLAHKGTMRGFREKMMRTHQSIFLPLFSLSSLSANAAGWAATRTQAYPTLRLIPTACDEGEATSG